MLKFDFFLFVGFAVQFLVIVNNTQVYERVLTAAAVPILILLLLLAGYSAQREWIIGTIISLVSLNHPVSGRSLEANYSEGRLFLRHGLLRI